MYKLLVATDGSEHSLKTARHAAKIAKKLEAEVTVLSVIPEVQHIKGLEGVSAGNIAAFERNIAEGMKAAAEEAVAKTVKVFTDEGIEVKSRIEKGSPAEVICEIAEKENFDEVLLGSRGYGGIKGFLLGSVSNKVVNMCSKIVTVVK